MTDSAGQHIKAPSLWQSFVVQRRVVWALIMREVLTRYGRHNIGFLWLLVEPMIFTLAVTALWTATQATHGSSLPIVAFALTGYSAVLLWRNMPNRCVMAIQPNLALLYHRNVRIIDIFLARILLEAAGVTISFTLLALVFHFLGMIEFPEDVLQLAGGWLMLAWFGGALGLLLGSLSERSEMVEKLWHPLAYILFPLSGAAFLVDALPPAGQQYVLYLPMVHGTELIREAYFGSRIHAHYDIGYMMLWNIGLTFFALIEVRRASRTVVPE